MTDRSRAPVRRVLVCVHDATPAYDRETRAIVRGLAPLVGCRFSFGVVPDWHGEWPLTSFPDFCGLLRESAEELLLHGCFHRRLRGRGPVTLLTGGSDELTGLSLEETQRLVLRGQRVFSDAFGEPARGFLAPAWQCGHVHPENGHALGLEHVLGFLSLESSTGRRVPLATWTWDCGRWSWPGVVGDGIGSVLHALKGRVPSLAIHPRDLERGYWPRILRLVRNFLDSGYEPIAPAALLGEQPW